MDRMINTIAKAMWRGMGPIRRPLTRKFHRVMDDHQRSAVDEIDRRIAHRLHTVLERLGAVEARSHFADSVVQELNLGLEGMVRELTRLQTQIELLQQGIEEYSTGATVVRLGKVDEVDDRVPYATGDGDRLRPWGVNIIRNDVQAKPESSVSERRLSS